MFTKKTIKDVNLKGKRVLLRADYNVPLKDGVIQDDFRIQATLPTLDYLIEQGCKIVIGCHVLSGRSHVWSGLVTDCYKLSPHTPQQ